MRSGRMVQEIVLLAFHTLENRDTWLAEFFRYQLIQKYIESAVHYNELLLHDVVQALLMGIDGEIVVTKHLVNVGTLWALLDFLVRPDVLSLRTAPLRRLVLDSVELTDLHRW